MKGAAFASPPAEPTGKLSSPATLGSLTGHMDDIQVGADVSPKATTSLEGYILGEGSGQRRTSCHCLQRQIKTLSQLKEVEQHETPMKLDVLLACTKRAASVAEALSQCTHCQDDSQALFITVMSFHTIFRWVKTLCHPPNTPCINFTMKLGQYEVSTHEAQLVKYVLLSQAIDRINKIANALSARVHHMISVKSNDDLWEFESVHLRALQCLVRSLPQTSLFLKKKLGQSPLSA